MVCLASIPNLLISSNETYCGNGYQNQMFTGLTIDSINTINHKVSIHTILCTPYLTIERIK